MGVDVEKRGIESLKRVTDDLYPEAFCSVVKDPRDPESGLILHADGAGTKPIVSYIYCKETGDYSWFSGLAQDIIAMNLDDIACVGGTPEAFSDYVAFNTRLLERELLLSALGSGFSKVFQLLKDLGCGVLFCGGETADLPDIIRTIDVSGTVFGRVQLRRVITGSSIAPGDAIVGIRSGGRCRYEEKENSGMMCNGISLARHALLSREHLRKYPEVGHDLEGGYYGKFRVDDFLPELGQTVGEAILSPTRIFLPIILDILKQVSVKALVHNTGGGLTKSLRLGRNILYIKDALPEPDPIFHLIGLASGESKREMYRNYNMGVGMEVIVRKEDVEAVIGSCERFGVGVQVIGRCERSNGRNAVLIKDTSGEYLFQAT
ncbi:MAG: AIR synthase-related protein [Candidatus Verstraetearchaeota archaeon]|nr:AIR synthase-related protein [Candidatus Verstraetearchaeota archaeon]